MPKVSQIVLEIVQRRFITDHAQSRNQNNASAT